jgi:hypothetical protein
VELTLPKVERIRAKDMLKMIRETVERLLETSPAIPTSILDRYNQKFGKTPGISHPEIASGVEPVTINRNIYDDHEDPHVGTKVIKVDQESINIEV